MCVFCLGNGTLISEALRHYQRLENENQGEKIREKTARKSDKHRRHYQIKECRIRPIIVQQAATHKIKVSPYMSELYSVYYNQNILAYVASFRSNTITSKAMFVYIDR